MLFGIAVVLYVIVCLILILLVIIQSDKGGGISGAIGGGLSGAGQFLGTQDTANILTRATTGFAIAFMGLCIVLSLFLSRGGAKAEDSAMKKRAEQQQQFSPSAALQGGGIPMKPQGAAPAATPSGKGSAPEALPVKPSEE